MTGPTPISQILEWLEGRTSPNLVRARATSEACTGRFDVARRLLDEAVERGEQMGDGFAAAAAANARAIVERMAGDAEAALLWQLRSCETFAAMENNAWLPSNAARVSLRLSDLERYDEADGWAGRAEAGAGPNDFDAQMAWRLARARVVLAHGSPAEAVRLGEEAIGIARQTVTNALMEALREHAVIVALSGGNPAPYLHEALELYEQKGNVVMAAAMRDRLAEVAGG